MYIGVRNAENGFKKWLVVVLLSYASNSNTFDHHFELVADYVIITSWLLHACMGSLYTGLFTLIGTGSSEWFSCSS